MTRLSSAFQIEKDHQKLILAFVGASVWSRATENGEFGQDVTIMRILALFVYLNIECLVNCGECSRNNLDVDLRRCPLPSVEASDGPVELHLMPMLLEIPGRSYMTRAYAVGHGRPSIPGPIIYMKQNSIVRISLYNDLSDRQTARKKDVMNGFFEFNTTNLHLHGIHVQSEEPQDDIGVHIPPGYYYQYEYDIKEHSSGLHMYHAHAHGAITIQVGGGAFGLLVVKDEESNSPFQFLKSLPSMIISIWQFSPNALSAIADENDLFRKISGTASPVTFLVNGFVQPKISVNPNQWYRWRIQHSSIDSPLVLLLDGCQMMLLALDGIWLRKPRLISSVRLLQPSRAEVAVKCPKSATYRLMSKFTNTIIATVNVDGSSESGPTFLDLSLWKLPEPPAYLQDTLGLAEQSLSNHTFTVFINSPHPDGFLNDKPFTGDSRDKALHYMLPGTTEQWTLTLRQHPVHIHTFPFQLQKDSADGFYKKGDWLDTYDGDNMPIRLHIGSEFNGKVMIHCHLAQHSDMGIMGLAWIDGQSKFRRRLPIKILYRPSSASTFSLDWRVSGLLTLVLISIAYSCFAQS